MSETEKKIIKMIAEGKTSKEIAAALNLSYGSVRCRIQEIYIKTGFKVTGGNTGSHRVALTRWAILNGLALLFALFLVPGAARAQVPAWIQGYHHAVQQSNSGVPDQFSCNCFKLNLPNPVAAANNGYVLFQTWGDTSSTITLTATTESGTSTSPTFTEVGGAPVRDTGNGQSVDMWVITAVPANTQYIKVQFSGTLPNHTGGFIDEYDNLATSSPIDVSCNANPSSTASPSCSLTTTGANELVVVGCTNDNPGAVTSWTAGSGFTLLDADEFSATDNHCGELEVKATAGGVTASITGSATGTYLLEAVAVKSASNGGTLGAGMHVVETFTYVTNAATGTATPVTLQIPCQTGNLANLKWLGASGDLSSAGGYTSVAAGLVNGASGTAHGFYRANVTLSPTDTSSLTASAGTSTDDQVSFECISGAATAPLDTGISCPAGSTLTGNSCQRTGTQGSTGQFSVVGLQPSTSNGIITVINGQASENSDPPSDTPMTSFDPPNENNELFFLNNTNTTSQQFKVTCNVGACNAWASYAWAEKAAPAASGTPMMMMMGKGK